MSDFSDPVQVHDMHRAPGLCPEPRWLWGGGQVETLASRGSQETVHQ